VWAYGFFRALAFGVPFATGTGGFGLGLFVVLVLYVLMVRRSRGAWLALVILDVLSLVILVITQAQTSAPWALHIFTALAIVSLLMPATRRYVTGRPDPHALG
jgi:nicotinamide riboside transporter PnuC